MIPYHRIAAQFFNRPLYLLPAAAETIAAVLLDRMRAGPRTGGGDDDSGGSTQVFRPTVTTGEDGGAVAEYHQPRASRFHGDYPIAEDGTGRPEPFRRTADGVAILTLVGEWVNRGAWVGASSGMISYEGFKYQLGRAAADSKTRAILLDLESPGGEAVGAFEAAAAVRAVAARKPVVALVNGMAASAAYAIASGASRIVTIPTGISGSIGVVMMHLDFSQALAVQGVKPTLIFAGAHKVDGNPFSPLPEGVRAEFQRQVDTFYSQFVETVAAGRRGMSAKAIRETEARIYSGADAVAAGLADSVDTFENVLAELSRGSGRANSNQSKGLQMESTTGAPAATQAGILVADAAPATVAELAARFPELVASIRTDAATAERGRILGIEKLAMAGHDVLIAGCKADPAVTPEQAAIRILQAEQGARGGRLDAIKGVNAETSKIPAAPAASSVDGLPELNAYQLAQRAQSYIAERARDGVRVGAAEAVVHVERQLAAAGGLAG